MKRKLWLASLQLKKLETEKDNMSLEINFSLVMLPNNRYADKDEIPIRKQETVFMRLLPDINPLLFSWLATQIENSQSFRSELKKIYKPTVILSNNSSAKID